MATNKPHNLIKNQKTLAKHYTKGGKWKMDKANEDGYDDVPDYAREHPEYVFNATEHSGKDINPKTGQPYKYTNKYVGIHDPAFAQSLGVMSYAHAKAGGLVVRVGERKVK